MAGLLQTIGPVTSHRVVARNWKFLRMLTVKQFMVAANELEQTNMGKLVCIGKSGNSQIFIKAPPEVIQLALEANPDLCGFDYYVARYNKPVSKSISLLERHHLTSAGLVPRALMM